MHKNGYLMTWLFFFGLGICLLFVGYAEEFVSFKEIMKLDNTGTTIFIIFVFLIGFLFSIADIIWLQKLISKGPDSLARKTTSIELKFEAKEVKTNYILWLLPVLGFVGTLIGVMIIAMILGQKISGEADLAKITSYIQEAIGGVTTAAFTSIVGMLTSAFLMVLNRIIRLGYIKLVVGRAGKDSGHENT